MSDFRYILTAEEAELADVLDVDERETGIRQVWGW